MTQIPKSMSTFLILAAFASRITRGAWASWSSARHVAPGSSKKVGSADGCEIPNCGKETVGMEPQVVGMGVGQNKTTRRPQVLVLGSIYQGFILGTYF